MSGIAEPPEPTLTDDEAQLALYADELHGGVVAAVPSWIRRLAAERAAAGGVAVDETALDAVVAATVASVGPALRGILDADVDAGVGSPLEALRSSVGPLTDALRSWGAAAPHRDDFLERAYPNDPYQLGPASFSDVDESLHEPGLVWGAARAHVHLRRRRDGRPGGDHG